MFIDRQRRRALLVLFVAWSASLLATNPQQADRIVVYKTRRVMELQSNGRVIKGYKIALGPNSVGAKTRQGDHRTPEGLYRIDAKNAKSRFHLALHISYPNEKDREQARKRGVS